MTDTDLHDIANTPVHSTLMRELARQLLACRHDLAVCADKLATASAHLGLVALKQPERFWTRTPPICNGYFWWSDDDWDAPEVVFVREGVVHTTDGFSTEIAGMSSGSLWSGPITPPTLVAPE